MASKDDMLYSTPAHKQTDPAKKPGQIVNPIVTDTMTAGMDDTLDCALPSKQAAVAAAYRPTHGGYPDYTPDERAVLRMMRGG